MTAVCLTPSDTLTLTEAVTANPSGLTGEFSETSLVSLNVAANEPAAGSLYHLKAFGSVTSLSWIQWYVSWGSTNIFSSYNTSSGSANWVFDSYISFNNTDTCNGLLTFVMGTSWNMNNNASDVSVTVSSATTLALSVAGGDNGLTVLSAIAVRLA